MYNQLSTAMLHDSSFRRNVELEGAFIDDSVPIDEAIAAHAARSGAPDPHTSTGGIDPPEDEPPSLRKRGVIHGSQSVSSADQSQRSAYEGSTYMEQTSRYQQIGSPFDDGVDPRNSYYQEDADNYGDEYRGEVQYQPDNKYDRQDEFQPDETYDRHDFQPSDEYSRQEEFQPDDEYDRQEEYQPEDEYYEGGTVDRGSYDDITPQPSEEPFSADHGVNYKGLPSGKEQMTSPMSGSEFTVPSVSEGGLAPGSLDLSPTNSNDPSNPPPETTRRGNTSHFPPQSPRSSHGTDFSPSNAMRGAQELLRRNRKKRLELAQKMKQNMRPSANASAPLDEVQDPDLVSPQSQDSGSTWQTNGSECTGSEVTGGSSIWTEGETNPDRSSRRALILQMARARMKSHGKAESGVSAEEKKLEHSRDAATDIDLTGDLD